MTDFGRFRLAYEPPTAGTFDDVLDHTVEMTISGEASLENITSFFTCFLRACGYIVDGELAVVSETVTTRTSPYEAGLGQITMSGSQGVDFVPFGQYASCPPSGISGAFGDTVIYGGQGTDTISFG
jgi:hypothetical protein